MGILARQARDGQECPSYNLGWKRGKNRMLVSCLAPLLVSAAMTAPVPEPTEQLPPIDATQAAQNTGTYWPPRRLPPPTPFDAGVPNGWPTGPSVASGAFSNVPYRLPVDGEPPAVSPVTYPRSLSEPLLDDIPEEPECGKITSFKSGVFQKLSFTTTWLYRNGDANVGGTELALYGSIAFPLPTVKKPMVITPGFSVYYIDGPSNPAQDLPPQVYDAYLEFRWINIISDHFLADLAISPGVHSDFEHWDDSALRFTGRGIGVITINPRWKIVLGVIYLDRDDVSMLPAAGVIWTPTDDWSLELVSPRPRIARRISCDFQREDWIFIAGELGGGSWSVERANLTRDVVTSRDYRVMIGIERKRNGGAGARLDVGWVFNREIEYASPTPMLDLDSTLMLRGAIAY